MTKIVSDLASGKCKPCEGGVAPLQEQEIRNLLKQLDGWDPCERAHRQDL